MHRVEVAQRRREQRLSAVEQEVAIGAQAAICHFADCRVEARECAQQALDVLGCATVHDVQILRGCWRAVKYCGRAANDDELDTRFEQPAEESMEISDAWTGRSGKLLSPAMARQMLTVQKAPFGLGPKVEGAVVPADPVAVEIPRRIMVQLLLLHRRRMLNSAEGKGCWNCTFR